MPEDATRPHLAAHFQKNPLQKIPAPGGESPFPEGDHHEEKH